MSSFSRATTRKVTTMPDETTKPAGQPEKQPVSEYAPQRPADPPRTTAEPTRNAPAVYLTDAMIAPSGDVKKSNPIRLTQITGPAIDHIGKSTADQVELVALSIVENARSGAETILAEANVQAEDMVLSAETMAAEMRLFAASIRAQTDRRALQVNTFCANAASILNTMHALGSSYQDMIVADEAADREEKERPLELPKFLNRDAKTTTT